MNGLYGVCRYRNDISVIECDEIKFHKLEEVSKPESLRFWMYLLLYVGLLLFSGFMAGLTLTLNSTDLTTLEVLQSAGSDLEKRYAKSLIPLAKKHYRVLLTLVTLNALGVIILPILLDRLQNSVVAVLVSATLVTLFGEVLPLAICKRNGLQIAYHSSFIIWVFYYVLFPFTLPLSVMMEKMLGKYQGHFFRRSELEALIAVHSTRQPTAPKSDIDVNEESNAQQPRSLLLSEEEVRLIRATMHMHIDTAKSVMIKWENAVKLEIDEIITPKVIESIYKCGFTRIPIYEKPATPIGILNVHYLLALKGSVWVSVRAFTQSIKAMPQALLPPKLVDSNTKAFQLMEMFHTCRLPRMAFVMLSDKKQNALIGIVSLSDILRRWMSIGDENDDMSSTLQYSS
uniref:CNNM transmembrane domain-containing protein n=1 Tax=Trichuris muris TaxID=70415 RepID=A0A5S6QEG2_TRIMR